MKKTGILLLSALLFLGFSCNKKPKETEIKSYKPVPKSNIKTDSIVYSPVEPDSILIDTSIGAMKVMLKQFSLKNNFTEIHYTYLNQIFKISNKGFNIQVFHDGNILFSDTVYKTTFRNSVNSSFYNVSELITGELISYDESRDVLIFKFYLCIVDSCAREVFYCYIKRKKEMSFEISDEE